MYFYLAMVGFEPTPSDRVTRFRCANTIIYIQGIPGSYGYRSLEIIYYIYIYIYIYIYNILIY